MNNKTLIWIDDRDDKMEQVAYGTFPYLWKEGILNLTAFFGDNNGEISASNVMNYKKTVKNLFIKLYDRYIDPNNEESVNEYHKLFKLYNEIKPDFYFSKLAINLSNNNETNKEKICFMTNLWKTDSSLYDKWIIDKPLEEKYSVECLLQTIDNYNEVSYALDLVLLEGDLSKLNCNQEDSEPVISMELYHYITKKLNRKCMIYSQYTYLDRLQNNWKYLYTQRYKDTKIEDINIVRREGLYKGSIKEETINELINLFDEEGK